MMTTTTQRLTCERFAWATLLLFGLWSSVMICLLRFKIMCPVLGVDAFEFVPLSGIVHGRAAHLFCRIMHNLTHPILLAGYTAGLAYVESRFVNRPLNIRFNEYIYCSLGALQVVLVASYYIALRLPF